MNLGEGVYLRMEDRPTDLTDEEVAWEDSARGITHNPVIRAFVSHALDVEDGTGDPEDGLETYQDVVERWVWYLAEGEQEVSWYTPVLEQSNAYFEIAARNHNIEYRPGLTKPLN